MEKGEDKFIEGEVGGPLGSWVVESSSQNFQDGFGFQESRVR
jgi:hypothetical protein